MVLLIIDFIWGFFDYVISGYSIINYIISESTSVYFDRLSKSIHFDSIYPLLRWYYKVMPGG
jgi:hypothetical protein